MLLLFHSNASFRAIFYTNVTISMAPQTGRLSKHTISLTLSLGALPFFYAFTLHHWVIWSRIMIMLCFSSFQPLLNLLYKCHSGVPGPWEAESPAKTCLRAPGKVRTWRQMHLILLSLERQLGSTWLQTLEMICLLSYSTFMICGFGVWLGFIF